MQRPASWIWSGGTPARISWSPFAPATSSRNGGLGRPAPPKPSAEAGGRAENHGAAPYVVDQPASEVAVDPYGPESPDFVVGEDFARMWTSALAHCHGRFEGKGYLFSREPSGGIGCFTPDSFPVFDTFRDNAYVIVTRTLWELYSRK